ncbi:macrolide 2'-phosphotransferase [Georgenia wangjunii]|uniref:macrolide 2'-phosphotransferase n=1 Tax=Georgenia wangjunii TaxID=3117730 RepID=UPI002F265B26
MPTRTPLALAALATVAIPGLDVVATRSPQRTTADFQVTGVLDSGGRHWVVRSPLHAAAGASLEAEVAFLENLAPVVKDGTLPFAVPRPEGFAPLPEGGRAMVYRQLPGRPLDLERLAPGPGLAAELGRAIASLHELPSRLVEDAGLPVYDADAYRRRCLAEVDEAARTGHVPPALLHRWEHALEDVALWRFRATPVHGDLAEEHILIADGGVSAILSFSETHVGDPAVDLAWLLATAPPECLDSIQEAYALTRTEQGDTNLVERAVLVSELALARWLLHGVRTDDEPVIRDAVGMLATLAEEVADEPPIGFREPIVVAGRTEAWASEEDAAVEPSPGEPEGEAAHRPADDDAAVPALADDDATRGAVDGRATDDDAPVEATAAGADDDAVIGSRTEPDAAPEARTGSTAHGQPVEADRAGDDDDDATLTQEIPPVPAEDEDRPTAQA